MNRRMFFQPPSLAAVFGSIRLRSAVVAKPCRPLRATMVLIPARLVVLSYWLGIELRVRYQKIERFGTLVRLATAAKTRGGK